MIQTPRLIIRQWRDSDRAVFAQLNADPEVMKFFPRPLSRAASDAFVDRCVRVIEERGYGLMAVERRDTAEFIGFIGLANPSYDTHFTPCTEIGWRLHKMFWGNGYATEGAAAVLDYAFGTLGLGFDGNITTTCCMISKTNSASKSQIHANEQDLQE